MVGKGKQRPETPPEIVRQLVDAELLQEWGAYSLKTRMQQCMLKFNYPITYRELRHVYKEYNVRYVRSEWTYRQAIEKKV